MKYLFTILACSLLMNTAAYAQIPVSEVHIVNSPNALSWPITTTLTRVDLRATGVHVEFSGQNTWPDTLTPGWDGPLQYTLWLFIQVDGQWYGSGIIQYWRGLAENGGNVTSENQIARNWVYDSRWGAMQGHQPAPGERVGFMVSAGNARGVDVHLIAERSNIVEVAFPSSPASFPPYLWAEGASTPAPTPAPVPPPQPPVVTPPQPQPTPAPVTDLSPVLTGLSHIEGKLDGLIASEASFHTTVGEKWKSVSEFVLKYIAPALGTYFIARKVGQ